MSENRAALIALLAIFSMIIFGVVVLVLLGRVAVGGEENLQVFPQNHRGTLTLVRAWPIDEKREVKVFREEAKAEKDIEKVLGELLEENKFAHMLQVFSSGVAAGRMAEIMTKQWLEIREIYSPKVE